MQKCLKTNVAKTEQDALTTTGRSLCLIVCGSHKNAYSGRVFLSHQLQEIICFIGKQKRETERYSPGRWRSQRALFARSCCDAPVRELGVSTGPPGRLCCRAGGQKEHPQGLDTTDHVIESNVTDSGASSGGNKWTESIKCWIDRCLKLLLARFHLIHISYQPKAQSGAAAKESITSVNGWDTNDFSHLPEFNFGVGYVLFSTTRKWLNKLLKRWLSALSKGCHTKCLIKVELNSKFAEMWQA